MSLAQSRRALTLAGTAVAVAALAACNSSASSSTGTSSSGGATSSGASTKQLHSVQFVNPLPDQKPWHQISECIKAEAQKNGLQFNESGPPSDKGADASTMIEQIQSAVIAKKDVIITFPSSDAFGPVLQKAQDAGVITATLYGDGSPASGAVVNGGVDWGVLGKQYVDAIAARSGPQVVGLITEGPTGAGKSWADGVTAAAQGANVKIAGTAYIGDEAAKALPQVSALLTAHPDINVIATNTGFTTQGAIAALKAKHLTDKVALYLIGTAGGGTEAIQNGDAAGLLLQDLCSLGTGTMDAVLQAAKGEHPGLVPVKTVFATKDDLQSYLDQGYS
jgi:ABC-type sugar transport system substrate-binding protein